MPSIGEHRKESVGKQYPPYPLQVNELGLLGTDSPMKKATQSFGWPFDVSCRNRSELERDIVVIDVATTTATLMTAAAVVVAPL